MKFSAWLVRHHALVTVTGTLVIIMAALAPFTVLPTMDSAKRIPAQTTTTATVVQLQTITSGSAAGRWARVQMGGQVKTMPASPEQKLGPTTVWIKQSKGLRMQQHAGGMSTYGISSPMSLQPFGPEVSRLMRVKVFGMWAVMIILIGLATAFILTARNYKPQE